MRNAIICVLLIFLTGAMAEETLPTSLHTLDEVYSLMVVTNDNVDNRLTYQENLIEDKFSNIEETVIARLDEMDERIKTAEVQQTQFIGERTNPLRINLVNIFFFVTCILFLMKHAGEEQIGTLGHKKKKISVMSVKRGKSK